MNGLIDENGVVGDDARGEVVGHTVDGFDDLFGTAAWPLPAENINMHTKACIWAERCEVCARKI